jgi:outer membrane protein
MQTNLRFGAVKLFIAFILALPGVTLAAETAPSSTPAPPAASTSPTSASKSAVSEKSVAAAVPATSTARPTPPNKAAIRFGYVDMTRFASDSVPGKAIRDRLKGKTEKYQAAIVSKQKQLEKQKTALEAKITQLSPDQRAAKAKEFQKKVESFQKYVLNAEKEMRGLEEQLTLKLYQAVEKAAAAYGKEGGFAAIVIRKDLLYQDSRVEGVDVTSAIIERVNKENPKL